MFVSPNGEIDSYESKEKLNKGVKENVFRFSNWGVQTKYNTYFW